MCLTFMIQFSGLWAQAADTMLYELYDVEAPTQFPGGEVEFYRYLKTNFVFDTIMNKDCVLHSVYRFEFILETDGTVLQMPKVLKNADCAPRQWLEVLQKMPRWQPAMREGKAVWVRYVLPLRVHWE